jgi:hypothetical protein
MTLVLEDSISSTILTNCIVTKESKRTQPILDAHNYDHCP